MTNAKRAPLLTLTLCMLVSFLVALERQASARAETEAGSAVVRSGDELIRAGDGCALVENGDRAVASGSCGEQRDQAGQGEQIPPPGEKTTAIQEITSPGGALPEGMTTTGEGDPCPAGPPGDATSATVARAVDGDTLELADEVEGTDRVRLIGVDAPELRGGNERPEPYAEEAAAFTADALEGKDVLLVPGEDETDDYGRLLAYVWTAPEEGLLGGLKRMMGARRSELFNRKLLREGYGEVLTVRPNDAYAHCLEAAQREAQDAGKGIWSTQETTFGETISSTDVASPEPNSPENTTEPTATTVTEQAITPQDASDEALSFSQEQTTRLERTVAEESDAATRRQYEDAWQPIAPVSPDSSYETTSVAGIDPTSPPVGSLSVSDVPHEGTVPVLPETGGSSLLALFGAGGLISMGLAALLANYSSPDDRPEENRDEDR